MNLSATNSGDWDNLDDDTSLKIGNVDDDYGLDLTMTTLEAPVIPTGKSKTFEERQRILMAPFVAYLRSDIGIGILEEELIDLENGVWVHDELVKCSSKIKYPLDEIQLFDIIGTLIYSSDFHDILTVSIPLSHDIESMVSSLSWRIGKTVEKSRRRIKHLQKLLDELNKIN